MQKSRRLAARHEAPARCAGDSASPQQHAQKPQARRAPRTALAFLPKSVPADTAARSMSPVAKWQTQYSSTTRGACVPLPHPGGPTRMAWVWGFFRHSFLRLSSATRSCVVTAARDRAAAMVDTVWGGRWQRDAGDEARV